MELAQAKERVHAAQEAQEKHQENGEDRRRKRKVQIAAAFKLAVEQARKWRG